MCNLKSDLLENIPVDHPDLAVCEGPHRRGSLAVVEDGQLTESFADAQFAQNLHVSAHHFT